MSLRGMVFDLDGVLIDSEGAKAEAHMQTARELGGVVMHDDYVRVLGGDAETVAWQMIAAARLECGAFEYIERFGIIYDRLIDDVALTQGALGLLPWLADRGTRLAVATSSTRAQFERTTARLDVRSFFPVTVTANDVRRSKPDPECYQLATTLLAVPAGSILVVEDTQPGISAAVGAGLRTIALRHRFNRDAQFRDVVEVVDSLESLRHAVDVLHPC